MQFSIVITTYNRLSLLKRAIASALAQTQPCEVIVVDDCSSDGTEAYMRQLLETLGPSGDRPLRYYRNLINAGHSAAVNRGVAIASGDWIKPLDDDDYLAPNCIAVMARAIAAHEEHFRGQLRPPPALCSCQAAQVDSRGVELSRTARHGPGKVFYIPQEDVHFGMLVEVVPFGTPIQVAFRREAFLQSNGWDSSLDTNCDDIDAWIRIARFGDAIFINQCLGYRTVWEGALNRKFPLQERFDTNRSIKNKIHRYVGMRHRPLTPSAETIESYLRLHWGIVALQQRRWRDALTLAGRAVLSLRGWHLLLRARVGRWRYGLGWRYRDTRVRWQRHYRAWLRRSSPDRPGLTGRYLRWLQFQLRLRLSRQLLRQGYPRLALQVLGVAIVAWGVGLLLGGVSQPPPSLSSQVLVSRKRRYSPLLCDRVVVVRGAQVAAVGPAGRSRPSLSRWLYWDLANTARLYERVASDRRRDLPRLRDFRDYIRLRWACLALRQGHLWEALRLSWRAWVNLAAWWWLLSGRSRWQARPGASTVRRFVLLDADEDLEIEGAGDGQGEARGAASGDGPGEIGGAVEGDRSGHSGGPSEC